jgi:hypothetical protein
MNNHKGDFKILALDVEFREKEVIPHIAQCGAILHELHSNTEIASLNTMDFGFVLRKSLHEGKAGTFIKPPKSITQEELFNKLQPMIAEADMFVCHKADHDVEKIRELYDDFAGPKDIDHLNALPAFCTMFDLAKIIGVKDQTGKMEKWLRLEEIFKIYAPGERFIPHNAYEDAKACLKIFLKAYEKKQIEFG